MKNVEMKSLLVLQSIAEVSKRVVKPRDRDSCVSLVWNLQLVLKSIQDERREGVSGR